MLVIIICSNNYTVEPLNKGRIGWGLLVLYIEVVHSSEVQNVLTILKNEQLGLDHEGVICRKVISIVSSAQTVLIGTVLVLLLICYR